MWETLNYLSVRKKLKIEKDSLVPLDCRPLGTTEQSLVNNYSVHS